MPLIQHRHILLLFYFALLAAGYCSAVIISTMAVFGDRDLYARFFLMCRRRHRHILFPHCHFTLVSFTKIQFKVPNWNRLCFEKKINCSTANARKKTKFTKPFIPPALYRMTNRIVIYDFFHFATYFCLLL